MRSIRWNHVVVGLFVVSLIATFAVSSGCDRTQAVAAPPPPQVTVAVPLQQEVINWDEYSGRLNSVDAVDVRARVTGFIESANFAEGSLVNKGDVLFVIDVRPFQAALQQAQADLQASEAQFDYAQANFKRYEELRPSDAASELEFEDARKTLRESQASINANKARVDAAKLDVEWCQVTAPISGRISNEYVDPGNLVTGGGGESTLLTTIVSVDPIYCYIDVDERSVLRYQKLARQSEKQGTVREAKIPVFMALADDQGYPHEGVLDFVDNQIDPNTGTIRVRGVFANTEGRLIPGLYARVRVPGSGRYKALLVPDSAIGVDQSNRYVLVVSEDNTVEYRRVQVGALFGQLRVISDGLTPSDKVIVNGLMRVRPKMKVVPQETHLEWPARLTVPGSPATQSLPTTGPVDVPEFNETSSITGQRTGSGP